MGQGRRQAPSGHQDVGVSRLSGEPGRASSGFLQPPAALCSPTTGRQEECSPPGDGGHAIPVLASAPISLPRPVLLLLTGHVSGLAVVPALVKLLAARWTDREAFDSFVL